MSHVHAMPVGRRGSDQPDSAQRHRGCAGWVAEELWLRREGQCCAWNTATTQG